MAAHFILQRWMWFLEILKSHLGSSLMWVENLGNVVLGIWTSIPLFFQEPLAGWLLTMTSKGKQDILLFFFGPQRKTSVLLREEEMVTQKSYPTQWFSEAVPFVSALSPLGTPHCLLRRGVGRGLVLKLFWLMCTKSGKIFNWFCTSDSLRYNVRIVLGAGGRNGKCGTWV